MRKLPLLPFYIFLCMSSSLLARRNKCIDNSLLTYAQSTNCIANTILGKVCSIQGEIEDVTSLVESCCAFLSGLIESCCESLAEQLECMATVVPPTQAAITDPGAYILCEDRGPLTISASGATLDMNGHNITTAGGDGLTITGDNVLVKNGRVIGAIDGVFGGVVIGAAASATQIRNVEVAATVGSTGNGLIIDSNGGVIEKVKTSGFTGASGNAFIISGPNNVLRYCVDEGGEIGFLVTIAGLNTLIENCLSENNPAAGFQLGLAGSALTNVNVIVRGCLARGAGAAGFRVLDGPSNWLIEDCIATASVDGFQVSTAQDMNGVIRGCLASANTSDGFQNSLAGPNLQIISNRSLMNGAFGFTVATVDQRLYNNSAFANTTANFNAAAIANNTIAVDPPGSDIGWWANV